MGSALRNVVVAGGVVAGGLLWACGGNGGSGVTPPPDGASVRVTVTRDGNPASGVPVGLFAVGGTTALATLNTASDGEATFSNLNPGPYEVEVTIPQGTELPSGSARQPVTATEGSVAGVTFALESVGGGGIVEVLLTENLTFSPSQVTIEPGQTVVWRNEVAMLHTVTPDGHTEWEEAQLSQAGATFSHTFDTPGSFAYFCVPHAGTMTGVITVE